MRVSHSDRWDEHPNAVKIAVAIIANTKGHEYLDATWKVLWCRPALFEHKKLFHQDSAEVPRAGSASNGPRSPAKHGMGGR